MINNIKEVPMKSLSGIIPFFFIAIFSFNSGCSCGNKAEIRDGDAAFNSMREGILMVTKKRCQAKPKSFNELVQCVEKDSTPGSGYGTKYLMEFTGINNTDTIGGSGKDIAFYYDFFFKAGEAGMWAFEFGVDSGIASGCMVDSNELWFEAKDIWTLGDYSQAFVKKVKLDKGWHRVRIYGLEDCCDGVWRLRFKSSSMKNFETVSVQSLGVRYR